MDRFYQLNHKIFEDYANIGKKGNIHTHNIKTLTTYQTGKSRCDAVYKESKRYDYLVQRILSAIGKNDKH